MAPAVGESLRAAERSMRMAMQQPESGRPAERAMRDAADALRSAGAK
jgi:hypothetical protein